MKTVKEQLEEHKDCRHEYCNLDKKSRPCWKVIEEDLRKDGIEDIKELRKWEKRIDKKMLDGREFDIYSIDYPLVEKKKEIYYKIEYIKKKFNIKEKDVK